MNTDGQVQKCIFEVLHREAINIVEVNIIDLFVFSNLCVFKGQGNSFSRCNRLLKKCSVRCHCALILLNICLYIFIHGDFVYF
jgi:hypothetical protein